jgi:hypothetical protein
MGGCSSLHHPSEQRRSRHHAEHQADQQMTKLAERCLRLAMVAPIGEELKSERVTTMMTPSEVRAVDDWSFAQRIRSRGEAIRQLIQVGLEAAKRSGAKPKGWKP